MALPEVIDRYCSGRSPGFMSLNVEGMELPILRLIDFVRCFPIVSRSPSTLQSVWICEGPNSSTSCSAKIITSMPSKKRIWVWNHNGRDCKEKHVNARNSTL